ncbi:MAG: hypothetical protein JO252_11115 [Planctomycetaceae bacterium]|nr:hypothetical protein [Planctomycetaceae bacterium]
MVKWAVARWRASWAAASARRAPNQRARRSSVGVSISGVGWDVGWDLWGSCWG